ncbi:hypothetical protein V8F33_009570 [Rhypophila sp. PSN 637]
MKDTSDCKQVLDSKNRRLALLDCPAHLEQWGSTMLILSGYPRGPRSKPAALGNGVQAYFLPATWPLAERERWNLSRGAGSPMTGLVTDTGMGKVSKAGNKIMSNQHTSEEKEWLKKQWGNEYTFL